MLQDSLAYTIDIEAEKALLGALVLDSSIINEIIGVLPNETFFYDPINKMIYKTIIDMYTHSEKIDFITLMNQISSDSTMDKIQIKNYLLEIVQIVPSIGASKNYANIIREKSQLRQILDLCSQVPNFITRGETPEKIISKLDDKLYKIRNGKSMGHTISIQDAMISSLDTTKSEKTIKTGFTLLDETIKGIKSEDLIFIAARPGMGKTSLALSISNNIAKDHTILFFSLEMSAVQIAQKVLTMSSEIEQEKIQISALTEFERELLTKSLDNISEYKLFLNDKSAISLSEIRAKIRSTPNVELVIIDYLQLIPPIVSKSNRVQEISEITRTLKLMSMELGIPIICLSQLSRASEQRADHIPLLSDLRDSGSIEQDADIVLMLYRPYYYDKSDKVDPQEAQIIVSKNRHGVTRNIKLKWDGDHTKFVDYTF